MTVDGFGFGTLTGESCLKNVHCHTDRASWDAILVTVVAFWSPHVEKVCTVTQIWLGEGGGGGYHWGGGGRRTENRDHIYGHPPPPRSTPASSTRFPEVASLHWTLLIYAENTVNSDTIVLFAMCMQTVLLQVAGLICV